MTQYGANLSGYPLPLRTGAANNSGINEWLDAVDDLVLHGAKWIRTGLAEQEMLDETACTPTALVWQESRLAQIDTMLAYVKQRGAKLDLLVTPPVGFTTHFLTPATSILNTSWALNSVQGFVIGQQVIVGVGAAAETLTITNIVGTTLTTGAAAHAHLAGDPVVYGNTEWSNVLTMFYQYVAARWAGYVDVWEVVNEGNLGDFRQRGANFNAAMLPYTPGQTVPGLDASYLSDLQGALFVIRTAIRTASSNPITVSVGEVLPAYDATAQSQFLIFLGALYVYLDAINVHMYDGWANDSFLQTKVGYLKTLQTTFGKPLYVTEFGEFGILGDPTFTEALQATIIPQQMLALAAANPVAIILYRYRDPNSPVNGVQILTPGAYTVAPTGVTFTPTTGGSGAAGTVQTSGTSPNIHVTGVTMTANGSGYITVPTVTFTGGTGTAATANANPGFLNEQLGLIRADVAATKKAAYMTFMAAIIPDPPTLTNITPASSPLFGGAVVTLTGTNFVKDHTTVSFSNFPATEVTVVSPTTLTCVVPEVTAIGASYVVVQTNGGSVVRADLFQFRRDIAPVAAITYATNNLIGMEDVGTGQLRAHIYTPAIIDRSGGIPVPAGVLDVDTATVVMTQVNRFDGHQVTFKENDRNIINAIVPRSTIELEEPGLGIVAIGTVTKGAQAVTVNGDGTVTVTMENITDEIVRTNLGLRYVDKQEIGQIVRNLGNATTRDESVLLVRDATGRAFTSVTPGHSVGWSADFLDDGTFETTVAPIQWGANLADDHGGEMLDLVATGNSVRRELVTPTNPAIVPCATGTPGHDDATHPFEFSYQVVVPTTGYCGVNNFRGAGHGVLFGFRHVAPYTVQIVDNGVPFGGLNLVANTRFKMVLDLSQASPRFLYYIQQPTDPDWVYKGASSAAAVPYYPAAQIQNVNGEFSNCIITHDVPMSRIWWTVKFDGLSNLGAQVQLAQDTGMFVRQKIDPVTAKPLRATEFGTLGENSGVTLVNAGKADLPRLIRNPRKRVINEITEYSSVDNTVTVLTPLGGGTYPAQLDLERPYLIINDPSYVNFGAKNFPEYDLNYTIHRTPATGGGYEYYIRYEPAFLAGGVGEICGDPYVNQSLGYPPDGATIAEQELAARTLYAAAVTQMQAGMRPRVTLTATVVGYGRPPRAGSKVAIDYTHAASDRNGPFVPMRITKSPADDGLWRVLEVQRAYGVGEPIDTYTLSSSGKYGDSTEAATGQQRAELALKIVGNTTSIPNMGTNASQNIDRFNPIILDFHIDESCYRVTKARFHVRFANYLQPVKTSDAPTHHHSVVIPDHTHATPSGMQTSKAQIGGMPTHIHQVKFLAGADTLSAQSKYVYVINEREPAIVGVNNSQGADMYTETQILKPDLAPTDHPHDIKGDAQGFITQPVTVGTPYTPGTNPPFSGGGGGGTSGVAGGDGTSGIAGGGGAASSSAGTGTAGGTGFGYAQTVQTTEDGKHSHDLPPDLHPLTRPSKITLQIDSGDGVLVERTAQVSDGTNGPVDGWTSDFVFECSRFFSPGRDNRVQFTSADDANTGRGALVVSWTVVGEYGGLSTITTAAQ